jgi:hypothetical protein
MHRARELKRLLQARFGSLEAIGAHLADMATNETEEAFMANPKNEGSPFRAIHRLGNGSPMYDAANCADFVLAMHADDGGRYGFDTTANPVTLMDCYPLGHHSFVVMRGRFIVDIWISLYAERTDSVVLDLHDKADHGLIQALYGDPGLWGLWVSEQKAYQPCSELPEAQRPHLGQHLKLVEPIEP